MTIDINKQIFESIKEIFDADDESVISLIRCDGHTGFGVYAYFTDYPEEGSMFLGSI